MGFGPSPVRSSREFTWPSGPWDRSLRFQGFRWSPRRARNGSYGLPRSLLDLARCPGGSSRSSARSANVRLTSVVVPSGLQLSSRAPHSPRPALTGLLSWDSSGRRSRVRPPCCPSIDTLSLRPLPPNVTVRLRIRVAKLGFPFRPRGLTPPRRFPPLRESRACCIPLPILGFAAFLTTRPPTRCRSSGRSTVAFPATRPTPRRTPLADSRTASPQPLPPRRSARRRAVDLEAFLRHRVRSAEPPLPEIRTLSFLGFYSPSRSYPSGAPTITLPVRLRFDAAPCPPKRTIGSKCSRGSLRRFTEGSRRTLTCRCFWSLSEAVVRDGFHAEDEGCPPALAWRASRTFLEISYVKERSEERSPRWSPVSRLPEPTLCTRRARSGRWTNLHSWRHRVETDFPPVARRERWDAGCSAGVGSPRRAPGRSEE
jgi:hypothetical protein